MNVLNRCLGTSVELWNYHTAVMDAIGVQMEMVEDLAGLSALNEQRKRLQRKVASQYTDASAAAIATFKEASKYCSSTHERCHKKLQSLEKKLNRDSENTTSTSLDAQ
ncbi:hypothetical protein Ciccas_009218 [Cichlidogyrus casuarinus]|uniref:Uncharacterized protein n=1 Tax=Cichlidogyrus casuarinus TaxID=1844966 RepID=A0ABD2PYM2_9PLAT